MSDDAEASIQITENGPYIVTGGLPLSEQTIGVDDAKNSWTWVTGQSYETPPQYALCRCGRSSAKPFCDGTHARVGFDGTESASRRPFEQDATLVDGPTMELHDNKPLCAFARFCDGFGGIWAAVPKTDSDGTRQVVAYEAEHCPSGRLVVRDKTADGAAVEPDLDPSVSLVEDPQKDVSGPIWVRGGVRVISSDGYEHEPRNRVTLCRCGRSSNKPFCDGTHAHIGFKAHPDSQALAQRRA